MRKYIRKPQRKSDHDYSEHGSYFVTICTKGKQHFFGEIVGINHLSSEAPAKGDGLSKLIMNEMQLNEFGQVAEHCWKELINHFEDIELDEFIIMPNHVHGILHLLPENKRSDLGVGTNHGLSLHIMRMNQRLPNIIKQYKSSVSREIKKQLEFYDDIWQRSYHDRIIRNQKELQNVRQYIYNNVINWDKDDYFT